MAFMKSRKITGGLLVLALLTSTILSGFTYQDGIGNVYIETKNKIYDDTYYSEMLAGHSTNGIERAYIASTNIQNSNLQPYVFEGEVAGSYSMDTMVNTLQNQGYKVVMGINGDVYDTVSGAPKGLTIHDGKLKTSGYAPEYVLCFDADGEASVQKVNLSYSLKGTINVPTIVTSTAIDLTQNINTEQPVVEPAQDPTDPTQIPTDPTQIPIDPTQTTTTTEPAIIEQTIYVPTEYSKEINFFNIPQGEFKGLHLYNRQYAPTTKTSGNAIEVILETGSPENAELTVGGKIKATVVEVKTNSYNTPITDSQLVLSTVADSSCATQIAQLIQGTPVEISVNNNNGRQLEDSKEAIGVYHVLYDNGSYISNGTNKNPRTVIGIKPDGTLIFYVLDGRQAGFSEGLGLTDITKHLVSLGCKTVVNMDGGGSSSMVVRKAGLDSKATVKNSPSGGSQRKITNGIFLVYEDTGSGRAEQLHTYPSQHLAMPGAEIQLSTYASDNYFEPVLLRNSVNYSINANSAEVDQNGLFTAGSDIGTATIDVRSGNLSATATIDVYDEITYFTNVQNLVIEPSKTSDVNVTAKYGYAPIASKDSLFTWTCDPLIGTIDENGLFTATGQTGVKGNIYVEYKNIQKTIPVQVGAQILDFADTGTHWAKDYIGKLAARGIVNGMGDNMFFPDQSLTRAQFLTMLANSVYGLDLTQFSPTGFSDVPEAEWFYKYINWGYASGIVNGIDETTFAPNANITREQMAIMLNNFTKYSNLQLPSTNTGVSFTDSTLISPWASEAVTKIVDAGIMGGHPEGNYEPQGNATRAQAATVIYKYCNIRDGIAKL